jgi:thiopeptide-type bacteriocin biosynthesis protein
LAPTRKFIPGDEWLYIKVYAGISMQEKLLKSEIYEVVVTLYKEKIIDKFFFIKYTDSDGRHLRLRFHLKNSQDFPVIINLVNDRLGNAVQNRAIFKITIDTYSRELERYGAENIEDVETIFSINSGDILQMFFKAPQALNENWLGCIKLMDDFLNQIDLDLTEKHRIFEDSFIFYLNSLGKDNTARASLKEKYREHAAKIGKIIFSDTATINEEVVFPEREQQKRAIQNIRERCLNNPSLPLLEEIVRSIIHMFCNRYFSSNQNTYELVIYYMMSNFYKSQAIIKKAGRQKSTI